MSNCLEGIRVIDLSMFVAGPFGTTVLAELGAEIIKIEPISGDPTRSNGVGPKIDGESTQFQSYNHDKKSISLNLKNQEGRQVMLDLVKKSDVVFNNFRPGVMKRLKLDHSTLSKINPKIVSVSLSGFGSNSPWSSRPGYDLIVQALGGGLSLNGNKGELPVHIPFHLGDTAAGLYSVISILSAVIHANKTGKGKSFEVSMLDAQLHLLSDEITFFSTGKWPAKPHGSGHPALAPYSIFRTKDKPIVIAAVGTEKFWVNLTEVLNIPEFINNPKFVDNTSRVKNMEEMTSLIQDQLMKERASFWIKVFQDNDVPAAIVSTVNDVINCEHTKHRNSIAKVGKKKLLVPKIPIREYGSVKEKNLIPAPTLNQDFGFILREILNYDDEKINHIKKTLSNKGNYR